MRQIMQIRAIRSMCYAIVASLVMSIVPPGAFIAPAAAQTLPTYSVAVVDFVNESGVHPELLARSATDAVVIEMSKTNRYDVGITRKQIKEAMDKLDLRAPLTKVGLVRLGEELSADAILEGSVKSVKLSGSGAGRIAKVQLAMQLVDQASGEATNGAVQNGVADAKVGFTGDDEVLIQEAIGNAAFLCVKAMANYTIPEATVMINMASNLITLNKGARDGIRPGMRMIVLRQREIIGYLQIQSVSPIDSVAKITKSLKGVQPEDRARAIYEMQVPVGSQIGRQASLPYGPPPKTSSSKNAFEQAGKILLGIGLIYLLAQIFKSGTGSEGPPAINTGASPTIIKWDPTTFDHGKAVVETQILRDDFSDTAAPFKTLRDPSLWALGQTDMRPLYGGTAVRTVTYNAIDTSPSDTVTERTATIPAEAFGTTHQYMVRVLYKTVIGTGDSAATTYRYSGVSSPITMTVIEPVKVADLISPAFDPSGPVPEIQISDLKDGVINFQWARKDGGNVYYVVVSPIVPGTAATFSTLSFGLIFESGPIVELPPAQRTALADFLTRSGIGTDTVMKWQVFTRNTSDTSPLFIGGAEGRFKLGEAPPPSP